jgi:hypothetical protein
MTINNIAGMARIDRLTLAIGEEHFGDALFETMRTVGDVQHCLVAVKGGRAPPRVRINVGAVSSAAGSHLIKTYEAGLYREDPAGPSGTVGDAEAPEWIRPLAARPGDELTAAAALDSASSFIVSAAQPSSTASYG